ncbi:MAG: exodeoxyribonuclease VII small subunit [Gemmatimonadaceae bacterium]
MPDKTTPQRNFEERLRRLDEILAALEGEQAGLDASLALFEEGVDILRSASAELGRAETKVQMLTEKAGGHFELREIDL